MLPYSIVTILVVLLVPCALSVDQPPRVTRPPTIMPERQMDDVIYFDPEGTQPQEFPCRALGNDTKIFEWTKNGKPLKIDNSNFEWTKNGKVIDFNDPKYISNTTHKPKIVRTDKNTGTIVITELQESDDGIYQCVVRNPFGVSKSKKFHFLKATKRTFNDPSKTKRYSVVAADNLKMVCNPPKNNPPGIIRWVQYYDEGIGKKYVELNDRISQDQEGNLYFANVQKSDENDGEMYTCEIQIRELNMYIEGAFSYIEVNDEGPAQVQSGVELVHHSEDDVVGLKGKSVTFQCIFTGNPTPYIVWARKTGGKLDKKRMITRNQKLTIKNVQYEDTGTYECSGKNSVTKTAIKHSFKLEVESKPEWVAEPKKVDAGVEEQAAFECSAEGRPPPQIQWFINGEPIENVNVDSRRVLNEGQLRFMKLTRDDAKVIQCNASNPHGYLWADVALSIMAYKPEIKERFDEIKVSEGKSVILPCEVDGKPTPTIFWKRKDQKMDGPGYIMEPTGSLKIENATMSETGRWTCFAENRYGKINSSGELFVRMKTKIDNPPENQTIKFGKTTPFRCHANTDPAEQQNLDYKWLKDGEPVDFKSSPRIKQRGSDIIIENSTSEDTGNYTCVASNGLDSDSASAELSVIAPPDPPTDVSFSACRSRSAIVSWTKGFDNFSPITKYYVEYNHSFAPEVWTRAAIVTDPTKTEARVKLSPHANYTFRVIAENLLGQSKPSERSLAACDANSDTPDKHPSNVHTDRSRTGWLIIKWDEMPEIEHNGPGFRYNLVIKKNGKTNTSEITDWTENLKEIYIGSVYEPYEIFVEAENEKGQCSDPAVVHIGYTGEAAPLTAPGNFELVGNASAKSATFQWDSVDTSPEMIRGEFKGYQIRYWKTGQRNTTETIVEVPRSPPRDTRIKRAVKETATVNSLPPYSDLQADVVAANTFYISNSSNIINFTTPEGVPERVKKARVVLRGAHHFLIEWEPPEEPNGILLGYEIGYKKVDGFDVGEIIQTAKFDDPYRSRAYIENLDENQEYTIYVWARTKAGKGKEYYFDAKTANTGPPISPEINIVLIGEDFVNVSWSVGPKQDAPAGSYYYVQYREMGKMEFERTEEERINMWMNVSGLEPNKRYELKVVAGNKHSEYPSELKQITTKGEPSPSVKTETSIAQAPWFIIMMILIAVLILIFIIVCFIKRSRGEKYNVQEREKLRGNDAENPEKDLFNEYPKSAETDPLAAGSPDSFDNEEHKLPGGSETDSMAEYGDVDPSKFNEDGSFIGQYGSQKPDEKGNQQSAMSTFV